jgi:tetratricopeptide (TPR) repeat protein
VAVYHSQKKLPMQSYTLATPMFDLVGRIEAGKRDGMELNLPLPVEKQPYDPMLSSKEYRDARSAQNRGDYEQARKHAKALVAKFPNSRCARLWEMQLVGSFGLDPELELKLVTGIKPPEDAPAWERGIYHFCLGHALGVNGRFEEAILSLRKSDVLYPDGMASAALTDLLRKTGKTKEIEPYARRATEFEPDRIAYWEMLQKILYAQGKYEEANKLQDRVYLLEDLY